MAIKRLVMCCDGTWNDSDSGAGYTNASRLAWAISRSMSAAETTSRRSCSISRASARRAHSSQILRRSGVTKFCSSSRS
jgi:hypothetical protein